MNCDSVQRERNFHIHRMYSWCWEMGGEGGGTGRDNKNTLNKI